MSMKTEMNEQLIYFIGEHERQTPRKDKIWIELC